jgi:RNA polymerase sigma factor (sigma-70 family)
LDSGVFTKQKTRQESDPADCGSAQNRLQDFLQKSGASLLGTIQTYVLRMGLARGAQVQEVALEVFQETIAELLAHADRFDWEAPLTPLLLGIAANVLKRRKVERAKRYQREELLSEVVRRYPNLPDEEAVLDLFMPPVTTGPAQIVETNEQVAALFALVSPEDQLVLRLAVLEGHQHTTLAQELGTTPGTARMRLHRALRRLRTAWQEQEEQLQKEIRHA